MKRQWTIVLLVLLGVASLGQAGSRRQKLAMSPDPLAWIGPLPAILDEAEMEQRWDRLMMQVLREAGQMDIRGFVCKRPVQLGAIPMMDAVERYIDGVPDSLYDGQALASLNDAAAKGNWLARTLIFFQINESKEAEFRYRSLVLAEWMHRQRYGQLYAAMGDALKASGYYSDVPSMQVTGFDAFAAMHHSYVAQRDVGKELINDPDLELASVGRRMLACASGSLPAYKRLFERQAMKARKDQ